ncbi:Zn-dependent hydrolase [Brevibacillus sp. SYP-B805]|uniref:Zn-dependent hydrolase n=1 Tax=Brevibacillus sp. SYP-B805 TaxID=1578199 RepID=UPI0013EDFEC4|nr:Zn-dependent hydrolase [Brevibacillus sp. SYP-B805]NGQ93947.1 Zn-dependent hydrolase [Brevibacillus sp. SYP-B805]
MDHFPLKPNPKRIQQDIETMATFVDRTKPGWTRRPFTTWYEQGRNWLRQQMLACGMEVEIDAAANLIGRIAGSESNLPPIMIGSHTDTVTGGGRFDGIVGVLAGLEIVRRIKETGTLLRHPLEIVDFTAEEPSEFGISTIGSRGMVNNLTEEMLARQDMTGLSLRDAIKMAGGDPERLAARARKKGEVALYLELHIEQGPVLEQTHNQLGVVTGIVGIHRYRVVVEGKANHAGTTPMDMRFDALTGASQLILELEAICREPHVEPVVGTVGKLHVEPNAANVIPGSVMFELEVRSLDTGLLEQIMRRFQKRAAEIGKSRTLNISIDSLSKSEAIRVDETIRQVIAEACQNTAKTAYLPSGAGHDANQLAKIAPIGMIFVPSKDGRSHCSEEWTDYADVARGVEALARAVMSFDQQL